MATRRARGASPRFREALIAALLVLIFAAVLATGAHGPSAMPDAGRGDRGTGAGNTASGTPTGSTSGPDIDSVTADQALAPSAGSTNGEESFTAPAILSALFPEDQGADAGAMGFTPFVDNETGPPASDTGLGPQAAIILAMDGFPSAPPGSSSIGEVSDLLAGMPSPGQAPDDLPMLLSQNTDDLGQRSDSLSSRTDIPNPVPEAPAMVLLALAVLFSALTQHVAPRMVARRLDRH